MVEVFLQRLRPGGGGRERGRTVAAAAAAAGGGSVGLLQSVNDNLLLTFLAANLMTARAVCAALRRRASPLRALLHVL